MKQSALLEISVIKSQGDQNHKIRNKKWISLKISSKNRLLYQYLCAIFNKIRLMANTLLCSPCGTLSLLTCLLTMILPSFCMASYRDLSSSDSLTCSTKTFLSGSSTIGFPSTICFFVLLIAMAPIKCWTRLQNSAKMGWLFLKCFKFINKVQNLARQKYDFLSETIGDFFLFSMYNIHVNSNICWIILNFIDTAFHNNVNSYI